MRNFIAPSDSSALTANVLGFERAPTEMESFDRSPPGMERNTSAAALDLCTEQPRYFMIWNAAQARRRLALPLQALRSSMVSTRPSGHLCAAPIRAYDSIPDREDLHEGPTMKKILAAAALAVTFSPFSALAQERAGDAALGALSGAVVLGPVGAIAGAATGYFAGPNIARSWGLKRSEPRQRGRLARRPAVTSSRQEASTSGTTPQGPSVQPAGRQTTDTWKSPPVQGFE